MEVEIPHCIAHFEDNLMYPRPTRPTVPQTVPWLEVCEFPSGFEVEAFGIDTSQLASPDGTPAGSVDIDNDGVSSMRVASTGIPSPLSLQARWNVEQQLQQQLRALQVVPFRHNGTVDPYCAYAASPNLEAQSPSPDTSLQALWIDSMQCIAGILSLGLIVEPSWLPWVRQPDSVSSDLEAQVHPPLRDSETDIVTNSRPMVDSNVDLEAQDSQEKVGTVQKARLSLGFSG